MGQWILLADQKPDNNRVVLITVDGYNPYVAIGRYYGNAVSPFFWAHNTEVRGVTYWMPLPEPATIPQK